VQSGLREREHKPIISVFVDLRKTGLLIFALQSVLVLVFVIGFWTWSVKREKEGEDEARLKSDMRKEYIFRSIYDR
jgi:hypothetical protein